MNYTLQVSAGHECPSCGSLFTRSDAKHGDCFRCGYAPGAEPTIDEDDELASETDLEGKMEVLLDRAFAEGN